MVARGRGLVTIAIVEGVDDYGVARAPAESPANVIVELATKGRMRRMRPPSARNSPRPTAWSRDRADSELFPDHQPGLLLLSSSARAHWCVGCALRVHTGYESNRAHDGA